jgi:hypothetical protein
MIGHVERNMLAPRHKAAMKLLMRIVSSDDANDVFLKLKWL